MEEDGRKEPPPLVLNLLSITKDDKDFFKSSSLGLQVMEKVGSGNAARKFFY